jgi:UDP-2,4-diacetamido-2,4,6-trideoxy-beta-L-altropyranose hydrolase
MSRPGLLVIYTEGGRARGLGHVSRCSAYARYRMAQGGRVLWLLDGDDLATAMIADCGEVRIGPWQVDPAALPDLRPAVAIVDSYRASPAVVAAIADQATTPVFIDDLQRTPYPRGLVVHPALDPAPLRPDGAEWLTGPSWQPLRPAFWSVALRGPVRPVVERVLVTLGGSDHHDLGAAIVTQVADAFPGVRIDRVTGDATASPSPGVTVHRGLSDQAMADLMLDADLAVSAAGTTTFELARCGVPTVLLGVADNQQANLDHWPGLCGFIDAGHRDAVDRDRRIRAGLDQLRDPRVRRAVTDRAEATVDGQGVRRLFERLQTEGRKGGS